MGDLDENLLSEEDADAEIQPEAALRLPAWVLS
jgi:hypothetical protein